MPVETSCRKSIPLKSCRKKVKYDNKECVHFEVPQTLGASEVNCCAHQDGPGPSKSKSNKLGRLLERCKGKRRGKDEIDETLRNKIESLEQSMNEMRKGNSKQSSDLENVEKSLAKLENNHNKMKEKWKISIQEVQQNLNQVNRSIANLDCIVNGLVLAMESFQSMMEKVTFQIEVNTDDIYYVHKKLVGSKRTVKKQKSSADSAEVWDIYR